MIRPIEGVDGDALVMQQLLYAAEVRSIKEIDIPKTDVKEAELKLAQQLIEQQASDTFDPSAYTDEVRARIDFAVGGVAKSFTTRNRHVGNEAILMHLVDGPFRKLDGSWRFDSLGDHGCRISLHLEYAFSSRMVSLVTGPVFGKIANSLVDAFQKRAVEVYGER